MNKIWSSGSKCFSFEVSFVKLIGNFLDLLDEFKVVNDLNLILLNLKNVNKTFKL